MDSTTISLFSQILMGTGRNLKKKVRKKRILPWRKLQSQRETDIGDHRQMELSPT